MCAKFYFSLSGFLIPVSLIQNKIFFDSIFCHILGLQLSLITRSWYRPARRGRQLPPQ